MIVEKLKSVLLLWVGVIVAISLASHAPAGSVFADNSGLITAVLLIYAPLLFYFKRKVKIEFLDSEPRKFLNSVLVFIVFSIFVFAVMIPANHIYQTLLLGKTFAFAIPEDLKNQILIQLVVVAFPEEFFFRGFLLEQFNQVWPKTKKLFGVMVGTGLLINSLLFAISHSFINVQWWHIFIFFPSLGFGWLREKTGSITASILFHAACNLFGYWIALTYR